MSASEAMCTPEEPPLNRHLKDSLSSLDAKLESARPPLNCCGGEEGNICVHRQMKAASRAGVCSREDLKSLAAEASAEHKAHFLNYYDVARQAFPGCSESGSSFFKTPPLRLAASIQPLVRASSGLKTVSTR